MTTPGSSCDRLGLVETYQALEEAGVGRRVERDVVRVVGPGARDYLQGQCTQDLSGLGPRQARFALLLSVQGKVEGFVRVSSLDGETFLVDAEVGQGESVLERLRRFKIRVKAELELARVPLVELRGPTVPTAPLTPPGVLVLPAFPRGLFGVDLLGDAAVIPAGIPEGDDRAFETARIEAGIPRMGRELDASTIPFEAGIVAETTSFRKGCYTGQELIARLEARGARVPRHLRRLRLPPGPHDELPAEGARLFLPGAPDNEVGRLTSVAWSPASGSGVALAYVQRSVEPPTSAILVPPGASSDDPEAMTVTIEAISVPVEAS